MNYHCINAHDFETESPQLVPASIHSPFDTLFYNFDFYGEKSTNASSVGGINFRYPPYPPVTEFQAEKDDFFSLEEDIHIAYQDLMYLSVLIN